MGAIVVVVASLLYGLTVARSVFWYDSAEFVAAAVTLGIPHPPGYPLYTLVAHTFTWLPLDPAVSVNVMSAVFATLAVALSYRVLRRVRVTVAGAAVGALALATCPLFWWQAVVAEVYTPALATMLLVLELLLVGLEKNDGRRLIIAGAVAGLGLGLHLFIATAGLGFALLVLAVGAPPRARPFSHLFSRASGRRHLAIAAASALAALIGATLIYAWLPLRSAMQPAFDYSQPRSWARFAWMVTGGEYKHWFGGMDAIDRALAIASVFKNALSVFGLLLGIGGIAWALRSRPIFAAALLLIIAGNLFVFADYQVHDFEVFFLPAIVAMTLFIGIGTECVLSAAARIADARRRWLLQNAALAGLLLYPITTAWTNYEAIDMSDFDEAEQWAQVLLRELPQNAVIFDFHTPEEWKFKAVFHFYYQQALGQRLDVLVGKPASLRDIVGALSQGRAVYVFHPIETLRLHFTIEPQLGLFAVTGVK